MDLPYRMDAQYKNEDLQNIDRCIVPLHYSDTAAYLIKGFKFNQQLAYGRILGTILAEYLVKEFMWLKSNSKQYSIPLPHCVIPVPLHSTRIKHRGFDQNREIVKIASKMLQLPIETKTCVRVLATRPQTELTRTERLQNVRGAFVVVGKVPTCVAVVDDVITTGATINELAQTLKRAGVQYIHAWAVARTGD